MPDHCSCLVLRPHGGYSCRSPGQGDVQNAAQKVAECFLTIVCPPQTTGGSPAQEPAAPADAQHSAFGPAAAAPLEPEAPAKPDQEAPLDNGDVTAEEVCCMPPRTPLLGVAASAVSK